MRWTSGLGIGVLALLGLTGCGGNKTDHPEISAAVVAGKPGFSPMGIIAAKGHTQAVKVGNTTDKQHGFSIDGYNIVRTVDPNQTIEVTFKATRAGRFRIFCQLHPAHEPAELLVK
jgi:nitrosocyanin